MNTPDYISQGIEAARSRHEAALENRYAEICEAEGKKSLQPYVAPEHPDGVETKQALKGIVLVGGVLGAGYVIYVVVIEVAAAIALFIQTFALPIGGAVCLVLILWACSGNENTSITSPGKPDNCHCGKITIEQNQKVTIG